MHIFRIPVLCAFCCVSERLCECWRTQEQNVHRHIWVFITPTETQPPSDPACSSSLWFDDPGSELAHTHGASLPSIQELKFLERTGANLHSPKPLKMAWKNYQVCPPSCFCFICRTFRQWPAGQSCPVPGAFVWIFLRSEASLSHFFAQFNQKVLRTLLFHQHQV